ncbi:hypothetical protein EJ04DRAFT_522690 [Polyplosphaeria fusca]|uniref:Uncharacterized protein n=1 Tax=Polyplosphaeria fusca TaxID=682080 RepID=A0A9P4R1W4_9PLEO|nr:hypothetical protein EJ04DRAFT_522690 [Polyplosphaeria fusca]
MEHRKTSYFAQLVKGLGFTGSITHVIARKGERVRRVSENNRTRQEQLAIVSNSLVSDALDAEGAFQPHKELSYAEPNRRKARYYGNLPVELQYTRTRAPANSSEHEAINSTFYAQTLATPSKIAFNTSLPFASKVYDVCGTQVHIYPVHHANASLLALRRYRYEEGAEYASFILNNDITLRIVVHFKLRPEHHNVAHWTAKLQRFIDSLVKKNPWLSNVRNFDVKIRYQPKSWVFLPEKLDQRVAGIVEGICAGLKKQFDAQGAGQWVFGLHLESCMLRLQNWCVPWTAAGSTQEKREKREKRVVVLGRRRGQEGVMNIDKGRVEWGPVFEGRVLDD